MAEKSVAASSARAKRVIGLVTLIAFGLLIYPFIFSDVKPEHRIDTTSQIPERTQHIIEQTESFKSKNVIIPESSLDRELEAHNRKQQERIKQENLQAELAVNSDIEDAVNNNIGQEDNKLLDKDSILNENGLPRAWVIQVVSFTEEEKSQRVHDTLIENGYKAYITKAELPNGTRYRVLVGPYINPVNSKKDKLAISKLIATNPVILNY